MPGILGNDGWVAVCQRLIVGVVMFWEPMPWKRKRGRRKTERIPPVAWVRGEREPKQIGREADNAGSKRPAGLIGDNLS